MDNINYEIKEVKGYSKKYKTKSGTIKETKPNKTVSLGANSMFNAGDNVIIISEIEFNNLMHFKQSKNKTKELETALKESSKNSQELERTNKELVQELQELKKEKEELQHQLELVKDQHQKELKELNNNLNKANDKKDTLYNSLLIAKDKLNYYEIILTKYKNMGIFQRLIKHDPAKEIPAPEPLEIPPKD